MRKLFLLGLSTMLFYVTGYSTTKVSSNPIELTVVHINDHHSHLEEEKMTLKLNGKDVTVNVGGMPRIAQKISDVKKKNKNTLALHAGDALSGTLYYTLFQGKADAALMNTVKFDYFTLGNHEFDDGNNVLKSFLDDLKIPALSANVIPDKGSILEGKWQPYAIKKMSGQDIAIVGLDVVGKTIESSSPGKDIKFEDELETARKITKELQSKGINKIIFVSHAGYEKNVEIAEKVSGIDLIITGDSHYLMGKEFAEFGLNPKEGDYPKKVMSPTGEPVYIAEAWNYSYLLGQLKIKFDSKGVITNVVATPQILIGDDFFEVKNEKGEKVQLSDPEKAMLLKFVKNHKNIEAVKNDPNSQAVLENYRKEKTELGKQSIGKIKDVIPGGSENRIPNEKNPEGSFATTLVAEAVLNTLQNTGSGNIDFVILNSGGVRITLNPGDFTTDQAYTLLPFTSNTVYTMRITGAEVKQVIEDALNFVFTGGSSGAFPYGAGIRYEATKEGTLGTRVKKVEVFDRKTNKWVLIDNNKTYSLGTNSYIASGKDGYTTFGKITSDPNRGGTDTYLGDAKLFIDYLKSKTELGRPASSNVKLKY